MNAKNYGIPQNRERVYLLFIKKDLDNGKFEFPEPFDNGLRLKDLLEDKVDEKFYISDEKVNRFITNLNDKNSLLYDPCQVKRETANCITSREDRGVSNRESEGTAVLETPNISYCLDSNYYKGTTIEQYMNKHRRQLIVENNKVAIRQATKQGYIECEVGGVADLSYPDSKTRRGRVQDNGNTYPTITATETGICRIEPKERFLNKHLKL